jgi:hypothetical protein
MVARAGGVTALPGRACVRIEQRLRALESALRETEFLSRLRPLRLTSVLLAIEQHRAHVCVTVTVEVRLWP